MSCLSLGKKLRPAKKAWKGFTSTVQKKLHKLKRSKAIKKTTNRFNETLAAVLKRSSSFPSRLLQRKTKKRVIARSVVHPHKHHKHHIHKQKFAPVYVDDLFAAEPTSIQAPKIAENNRGKAIDIEKGLESSATEMAVKQVTKLEMKIFKTPALAETSKAASNRGATSTTHVPPKGGSGQTVVNLDVPQFRGVDERAEEFIAKFKEEMLLQRQISYGEYQEMLARGV